MYRFVVLDVFFFIFKMHFVIQKPYADMLSSQVFISRGFLPPSHFLSKLRAGTHLPISPPVRRAGQTEAGWDEECYVCTSTSRL